MGDPLTICSGCGGSGRHGNIICGHCGGRGLVVDPIRKLQQDNMDRQMRGGGGRVGGRSMTPLPPKLRLAAWVLGGLAAYLAYRAFAPDPLAWGAALLAFAAMAYGLKLLHSIVTRPLQWLMLMALVFGVDHFLFEGALSAWLVQSGPGVIKGLFSG